MHLSQSESDAILEFYKTERIRVAASLKHIDRTIRLLSGKNVDEESGVLLTRKGDKAKKRGPKSVWGKFILDELKHQKKPLSYKDLMDQAMKKKNIHSSKYSNVRASILNSAFRLRAIQGKITTIEEDGKKEKFIVDVTWLDDKGNLPKAHMKWLKEEKDFYPKSVDMSELPSPKYEEDLR
ncbi:MAG: hypothetical protein ACO3MV_07440 [Flavobacteriales bacterium]